MKSSPFSQCAAGICGVYPPIRSVTVTSAASGMVVITTTTNGRGVELLLATTTEDVGVRMIWACRAQLGPTPARSVNSGPKSNASIRWPRSPANSPTTCASSPTATGSEPSPAPLESTTASCHASSLAIHGPTPTPSPASNTPSIHRSGPDIPADEADRGFCPDVGMHANLGASPALAVGPPNLTSWRSGRDCQHRPEDSSLGGDSPHGHAGMDESWSRASRSLDSVEVTAAADEPTDATTLRPPSVAHVTLDRSESRRCRTLSHPPRTFSPTAHGRIALVPPCSQRDSAHLAPTSATSRYCNGSAPCQECNR